MNISNTSSSSSSSNLSLISGTISFEALLMIGICFGNGLVIASFFRFRRLQTIANYFILNLACADFIVGIIMPFHIAVFAYPELAQNIYVCTFRYSSIIQAAHTSILLLLAVASERYIAIIHSLHYHQYVTERRAVVLIIAIWIYTMTFSFFFPLFWFNDWKEVQKKTGMTTNTCEFLTVVKQEYILYYLFPCFMLVVVIMMMIYCRIVVVAKKQADKIQDYFSNHLAPGRSDRSANLKKNMKMFKTSAIIIGLFLLCWVPFFTVVIIQITTQNTEVDGILQLTRTYLTLLVILNSAMNPVIYAFRSSEYKHAFKTILCSWRKHGENRHGHADHNDTNFNETSQ